jgi:hypothetical protein
MDNLLLKGVYSDEQSVAKGYSDGPLPLLVKSSLYVYSDGQFDDLTFSNGQPVRAFSNGQFIPIRTFSSGQSIMLN